MILFFSCKIVLRTACKSQAYFIMLSPRHSVTYYLFTLLFLSKQTRHWRNIVSFDFFLFICGRAKCLSREKYVTALCSSCSLPKSLERWPAARRSVLMLMKGSKNPRIELNTVHLYQHYSLFMPNKLLCTWRGDYCECVRSSQLPVLTEVRAPSLLEQYPRYVPYRDHAGYNTKSVCLEITNLAFISSILLIFFKHFLHSQRIFRNVMDACKSLQESPYCQ